MTSPDVPSPENFRWPLGDVAFAATQLAQEYPALAKDRLMVAVNSAVPFVPPEKGLVELMRRAREFLRH